ncbi:5'-3' exonuclease [Mycoplasma nasistruthionis]|uniref:5'-3' exonuclease n=1 Tax=Mycoplasma nasistruthionis TaxID=353852 RepID=A0A4Y6I7P0_9MOLU|nr:5'-3' exonuclease [Mycoplasma nasistruthionis]QDF64928.1 5'-3' exonuclease [Mycoplasma nasistruthionis]
MNKHLIIDGNYLMFQSFHASYNPNFFMQNSAGIPTNAINLFLIQMIKLIKYYQPTHLFIAFDSKEKSFRHELYDNYKEGRSKAPNELFIQFDLIKQILSKLNIVHQEQPGYEADDLVAAYCKLAANDETKIIFSRDKDLHQLIDQNTSVIIKDKTNNEYALLTDQNYFDNYNFYPNQVPDFKALAGDSSDNLPGVKGIGEKTAINILNLYGNIKNLYQDQASWPVNLTKSVIKKITENQADAEFCYKMATLNPNVENFDVNLEKYELKINLNNALDLLTELELKTVISYLK